MSWLTKLAIYLAVMAGCFFAGYFTHKPDTVVKTETAVKEVEKVVTKTVTKVVKVPDGTVTTETTTETTANKTEITNKNTPSQPVARLPAASPKYSAQIDWTPRLELDAYKPTGVGFGRRLGETNAWVEAGYSWRTKEVTAGFRVEF